MIKRVIILSAGQGSRLLPLTEARPKCLIDFNGRSLLAWQIDALRANDVDDIHVVTGFRADMVERELQSVGAGGGTLAAHFNPFYHVADNLGSLWLVRHLMDRDFLILNGDTLVSRALVADVLAAAPAPIGVSVDVKEEGYDSDDMRVELDGDTLLDIGKRLPVERSHAESIGLLRFSGAGPARFHREVERMMREDEGLRSWYLRAIHHIASERNSQVKAISIAGHDWGEVDFPRDVEAAKDLTAGWVRS